MGRDKNRKSSPLDHWKIEQVSIVMAQVTMVSNEKV